METLKVRCSITQMDCNGNFLKKENKSIMLIMSDIDQWNCLSFTACGDTYSMQITKDDNKFILQLGKISPPGFIHEAFRFSQGGIKGKYRPSEDIKCVNEILSSITEAEIF